MFGLIRLLILSKVGRMVGKVLLGFAFKKYAGKNRRFRSRPVIRW